MENEHDRLTRDGAAKSVSRDRKFSSLTSLFIFSVQLTTNEQNYWQSSSYLLCRLIDTACCLHTLLATCGTKHTCDGSIGDGNRDEDNGNGNEDRIGEGGREAEKRETWVERGKYVEKK